MNTETFYHYTVKWYAEDDGYKEIISQGFVLGSNFGEVCEKVEASYDCIQTITLDSINDLGTLELDDLIDYLKESNQKLFWTMYNKLKEAAHSVQMEDNCEVEKNSALG